MKSRKKPEDHLTESRTKNSLNQLDNTGIFLYYLPSPIFFETNNGGYPFAMKILFLTCILILISIESTEATKRRLEESEVDRVNLDLLNMIREPVLEYVSRAELVEIPKTVLRLVCKMAYQFCGRGKKWVLTNTNYPSFKQEMHNEEDPWLENLLANLPRLSFRNSIDEAALEDDSELQEWENKYVFISAVDLEYIMKGAIALKELDFYNVPTLKAHLTSPLPCANSLQSFGFNYDTEIFDDSIKAGELAGCSQFTRLISLSLHSGIFSSEGEAATFFSPFTNLETLRLDDVDCDNEHEKHATDLFRPLTCLKKLSTLEVAFIDQPDLLPLTNLSPLVLKTLSIECNVKITDEDCPYTNILPQLLSSLVHLEDISIHNEWQEKLNVKMYEVFSNSLLEAQKYPP